MKAIAVKGSNSSVTTQAQFTITTGGSGYTPPVQEEPAGPSTEEILAKLASYKLVARSMVCKSPSGKNAIRIRVYDKNGLEVDFFDGMEVYRSTKKNSGYGKKPIFTSKTDKYYNTAVKAGTTYYYKVRGFVTIDGKKYYTAYSLKVIRTMK